jgi:hypothetical protein
MIQLWVNTYIGISEITDIIYRAAKLCGKEDVFKEMMQLITSISEKEIGKVKMILAQYGMKVGVYLYDGDKPEPTGYSTQISSIIAKGEKMLSILSKLGYDVSELKLSDSTHYLFDGQRLMPLVK